MSEINTNAPLSISHDSVMTPLFLRSSSVASPLLERTSNGDLTATERRTNGERTENERRTNGKVTENERTSNGLLTSTDTRPNVNRHLFLTSLIKKLAMIVMMMVWGSSAWAQSVVATWDFRSGGNMWSNPTASTFNNYNGKTHIVSDVAGVAMIVDATSGKLQTSGRSDWAQVNATTKIYVPVVSTKDRISIWMYSDNSFSIGSTAIATKTKENYEVTQAEVSQGYVVISVTADTYLGKITATLNDENNAFHDFALPMNGSNPFFGNSVVQNKKYYVVASSNGVAYMTDTAPTTYAAEMSFAKYHGDAYGYENILASIPVVPGKYDITIGTTNAGGPHVVKNGSTELKSIATNTGTMYNGTSSTTVTERVTVSDATTLTITNNGSQGTYTPYFAISKVNESGKELSVTVTPAGYGTIEGEGRYPAGTEVTLKAKANRGYQFVRWTDASDNVLSTNATHTYTMPDADVTLKAVFEAQTSFEITFSNGGDASIGGIMPSNLTLYPGESWTVPANHTFYKEGYTYDGWTDGTNVYTVGQTVSEAKALIPHFTQNTTSIATRTGEVIASFEQATGRDNYVANNGGVFVGQTTGANPIDLKATVAGKFDGNGNDYIQINNATTITVPSCKGATIAFELYSAGTIKINGNDVTTGGSGNANTISYTVPDARNTSVISNLPGQYMRGLKVTYPAERVTSNLAVTTTAKTMTVDDEYTLVKGTDYTTSSEGAISYTPSDENVITVDGTGKITAVGAGSATITVTQAPDNSYTEKTIENAITVTVSGPAAPYTVTWDWKSGLTNVSSPISPNVNPNSLDCDITTTGSISYNSNQPRAELQNGAKMQIPVASAGDIIYVTAYPSAQYYSYTIGTKTATTDNFVYAATKADVAAGYATLSATGYTLIYSIKVVHSGMKTFSNIVLDEELRKSDNSIFKNGLNYVKVTDSTPAVTQTAPTSYFNAIVTSGGNNGHGIVNPTVEVPLVAGTYTLTVGKCYYPNGKSNNVDLIIGNAAKETINTIEKCYDQDNTAVYKKENFRVDENTYLILQNNGQGTYLPYFSLKKINVPEITTNLLSEYSVSQNAELALTIEATNATGYQWYKCNEDGSGASAIKDATAASYTYSNASAGKYYVFCRVTNADGYVDSKIAAIDVKTARSFQNFDIDFTTSSGLVGGTYYVTATNNSVATFVSEDPGIYLLAISGATGINANYGLSGNPTFTFNVDGPVKITYGAHDQANTNVVVKKDDQENYASFSIKNTSSKWKNDHSVVASYVYKGGAATLTLTGGTYVPYLKVEKLEMDYTFDDTYDAIIDSGNATQLLQALNNADGTAEKRFKIFVPNGDYDLGQTDNNVVPSYTTIVGESRDGVVIHNQPLHEGIWYSSTLKVGSNVILQNLTLKCTATKGSSVSISQGTANDERGTALYDNGSNNYYKNIRLLSGQDTYYSDTQTNSRFDDCEIHGHVDFICGNGTVWFEKCDLKIVDRSTAWIAVPKNGAHYTFNKCTISNADPSKNMNGKYYLGRGWDGTPYAVFSGCTYNINPATDRGDSNGYDKNTWAGTAGDNSHMTVETGAKTAPAASVTVLDPPADVKKNGTTLSWTAVTGAVAYVVYKDGVYFKTVTGDIAASPVKGNYSPRRTSSVGETVNTTVDAEGSYSVASMSSDGVVGRSAAADKFDVSAEKESQNTPAGWTDVALPDITINTTVTLPTAGEDALSTTEDNASKIQTAINTVNSAGGGKVIIPAGTWLSGPITMKSNVVLHLSAGCTLKLLPFPGLGITTDASHYPITWGTTEKDGKTIYTSTTTNFINNGDAVVNDIVIEGEGETSVIDGQGGPWWDARETNGDYGRPNIIRIEKGARHLFRNFKIVNSVAQNIVLGRKVGTGYANNITVHDITIDSPDSDAADPSHNTDGIPVWAPYVNIYHCDISTGDDNIVCDSQADHVHAWDIKCGYGHGMSIGSYTEKLHDIIYEDIVFNNTQAGFRLKTSSDRSGNDKSGTETNGAVKNIICRNAIMTGVPGPIKITSWYDNDNEDPSTVSTPSTVTTTTPEFCNILFQNITADAVEGKTSWKHHSPIYLYGRPESYIHDITFDNVKIESNRGMFLAYCEGINFTNGCLINDKSGVAPVAKKYEASYTGSFTSAGPVTFKNFTVVLTTIEKYKDKTLLTNSDTGNIEFGIAVADDGTVTRVDKDDYTSIATIKGTVNGQHGLQNLECVVKIPNSVAITVGKCSYDDSADLTVNGKSLFTAPFTGNRGSDCWQQSETKTLTGYYKGDAGEVTIKKGGYTEFLKIVQIQPFELDFITEGSKANDIVKTWSTSGSQTVSGISFDASGNPVQNSVTPAIEANTYFKAGNGLWLYNGNNHLKFDVDGPTRITIGTTTNAGSVLITNQNGETLCSGLNVQGSMFTNDTKSQNVVSYNYAGGPAMLTITGAAENLYIPYIKVEPIYPIDNFVLDFTKDGNAEGVKDAAGVALLDGQSGNVKTIGVTFDESGNTPTFSTSTDGAQVELKAKLHGNQYGICGNPSMKFDVSGPVKIYVGTTNQDGTVTIKDSEHAEPLFSKSVKGDMYSKSNPNNVVSYPYTGEYTTLTLDFVGYIPYVKVEKIDFVPEYTVTYYDVDGTTKIGEQTVQGFTTFNYAYSGTDCNLGDKVFRGWFDKHENGSKVNEGITVDSDMTLYAIATPAETQAENTTYNYTLKSDKFYFEDHENIAVSGAVFDDQGNSHGWKFGSGATMTLKVGCNAAVDLYLCARSADGGKITVKDAGNNTVAELEGKVSWDGNTRQFKYIGSAPTTLTLTFDHDTWIHGVNIVNKAAEQEYWSRWDFNQSADPHVTIPAEDLTGEVEASSYEAVQKKITITGGVTAGTNGAAATTATTIDIPVESVNDLVILDVDNPGGKYYLVKGQSWRGLWYNPYYYSPTEAEVADGFVTMYFNGNVTVKSIELRHQKPEYTTPWGTTTNISTTEKNIKIGIPYDLVIDGIVRAKDIKWYKSSNPEGTDAVEITEGAYSWKRNDARMVYGYTYRAEQAETVYIFAKISNDLGEITTAIQPLTSTALETISVGYEFVGSGTYPSSFKGKTIERTESNVHYDEYYSENPSPVGDLLTQEMTHLPKGQYEVTLKYLSAHSWYNGNEGDGLSEIFANDAKENITVTSQTSVTAEKPIQTITLTANVKDDGILKYGIQNIAAAGNWYLIRVESIKYISETPDMGLTSQPPYDAVVSNATELKKALSAASGHRNYKIFLKNGEYDLDGADTEVKSLTTLVGESRDGVVIKATAAGNAGAVSVLKTGSNVVMQDVTILNTAAGPALWDNGANNAYKNIKLVGTKNTYYSGENANTFFSGGEIEGNEQFICGSGNAWFDGCKILIASNSNDVVIAAPTTAAEKKGFIFNGCEVNNASAESNMANKYYLASGTGKCAFYNTQKTIAYKSAWTDGTTGCTESTDAPTFTANATIGTSVVASVALPSAPDAADASADKVVWTAVKDAPLYIVYKGSEALQFVETNALSLAESSTDIFKIITVNSAGLKSENSISCQYVAVADPSFTATWDFQHMDASAVSIQEGKTGTVPSSVSGVSLSVVANDGKLQTRGSDAQFNNTAVIKVPITAVGDKVTIVSYPSYYHYKVNGEAANRNTTEITAESSYPIEIVATNTAYLYSITLQHQGVDIPFKFYDFALDLSKTTSYGVDGKNASFGVNVDAAGNLTRVAKDAANSHVNVNASYHSATYGVTQKGVMFTVPVVGPVKFSFGRSDYGGQITVLDADGNNIPFGTSDKTIVDNYGAKWADNHDNISTGFYGGGATTLQFSFCDVNHGGSAGYTPYFAVSRLAPSVTQNVLDNYYGDAENNEEVTLSIKADYANKYVWYECDEDGNKVTNGWTETYDNNTTGTSSVTVTVKEPGRYYRCDVLNAYGESVMSKSAITQVLDNKYKPDVPTVWYLDKNDATDEYLKYYNGAEEITDISSVLVAERGIYSAANDITVKAPKIEGYPVLQAVTTKETRTTNDDGTVEITTTQQNYFVKIDGITTEAEKKEAYAQHKDLLAQHAVEVTVPQGEYLTTLSLLNTVKLDTVSVGDASYDAASKKWRYSLTQSHPRAAIWYKIGEEGTATQLTEGNSILVDGLQTFSLWAQDKEQSEGKKIFTNSDVMTYKADSINAKLVVKYIPDGVYANYDTTLECNLKLSTSHSSKATAIIKVEGEYLTKDYTGRIVLPTIPDGKGTLSIYPETFSSDEYGRVNQWFLLTYDADNVVAKSSKVNVQFTVDQERVMFPMTYQRTVARDNTKQIASVNTSFCLDWSKVSPNDGNRNSAVEMNMFDEPSRYEHVLMGYLDRLQGVENFNFFESQGQVPWRKQSDGDLHWMGDYLKFHSTVDGTLKLTAGASNPLADRRIVVTNKADGASPKVYTKEDWHAYVDPSTFEIPIKKGDVEIQAFIYKTEGGHDADGYSTDFLPAEQPTQQYFRIYKIDFVAIAQTPEIVVNAGTPGEGKQPWTVELKTADPNDQIYYTLEDPAISGTAADTLAPTQQSKLYTGPFALPTNYYIKAKTLTVGKLPSDMSSTVTRYATSKLISQTPNGHGYIKLVPTVKGDKYIQGYGVTLQANPKMGYMLEKITSDEAGTTALTLTDGKYIMTTEAVQNVYGWFTSIAQRDVTFVIPEALKTTITKAGGNVIGYPDNLTSLSVPSVYSLYYPGHTLEYWYPSTENETETTHKYYPGQNYNEAGDAITLYPHFVETADAFDYRSNEVEIHWELRTGYGCKAIRNVQTKGDAVIPLNTHTSIQYASEGTETTKTVDVPINVKPKTVGAFDNSNLEDWCALTQGVEIEMPSGMNAVYRLSSYAKLGTDDKATLIDGKHFDSCEETADENGVRYYIYTYTSKTSTTTSKLVIGNDFGYYKWIEVTLPAADRVELIASSDNKNMGTVVTTVALGGEEKTGTATERGALYPKGAQATVTAERKKYHLLDHWEYCLQTETGSVWKKITESGTFDGIAFTVGDNTLTFELTEYIEVRAFFKKKSSYYINFSAGKYATGVPPQQIHIEAGDEFTMPVANQTLYYKGSTLKYWVDAEYDESKTKEENPGHVYEFNTKYTPTSSLQLYPYFEVNKYTLLDLDFEIAGGDGGTSFNKQEKAVVTWNLTQTADDIDGQHVYAGPVLKYENTQGVLVAQYAFDDKKKGIIDIPLFIDAKTNYSNSLGKGKLNNEGNATRCRANEGTVLQIVALPNAEYRLTAADGMKINTTSIGEFDAVNSGIDGNRLGSWGQQTVGIMSYRRHPRVNVLFGKEQNGGYYKYVQATYVHGYSGDATSGYHDGQWWVPKLNNDLKIADVTMTSENDYSYDVFCSEREFTYQYTPNLTTNELPKVSLTCTSSGKLDIQQATVDNPQAVITMYANPQEGMSEGVLVATYRVKFVPTTVEAPQITGVKINGETTDASESTYSKSGTVASNGNITLTFDHSMSASVAHYVADGSKTAKAQAEGNTLKINYWNLADGSYTFTLSKADVKNVYGKALGEDGTVAITFTVKKEVKAVTKDIFDFVVDDGTMSANTKANLDRAGISHGSMEAAIDAANAAAGTDRFYIYVPQGEHEMPGKFLITPQKTSDNVNPATKDGTRITDSELGKQVMNGVTDIRRANVSIIGFDKSKTTIWNLPRIEGIAYTGTIYLAQGAKDFYAQDMTVENRFPYNKSIDGQSGTAAGRAVALWDQSSKAVFKNVDFLSWQDTYYSNNEAPDYRSYFEDCKIAGVVDFLCGDGNIWFERTELMLRKRKGNNIVAPRQQPSQQWGYVLNNCRITAEDEEAAEANNGNYTLGRPWAFSPAATYLNTDMEVLPQSVGWNNMNTDGKLRLHEYGSKSGGVDVDMTGRSLRNCAPVAGSDDPILTADEAAEYDVHAAMAGDDLFDPTARTAQRPAVEGLAVDDHTMNWTDDDEALCYFVFKSDTEDGEYSLVTITTANELNLLDLNSGTGWYAIRSANEYGGLGVMCNPVLFTEPESYTLTISELKENTPDYEEGKGWSTICLPFNAKNPDPEHITLYAAIVIADYKMELKEVDVINAGEGYVVHGDVGSYTFRTTTKQCEVSTDDNLLEGNPLSTPIDKGNHNCYVLSNKATYGLGFYKYTGKTLAANRAWLPVDNVPDDMVVTEEDDQETANSKMISFYIPEDETPTITKPDVYDVPGDERKIYDLSGQRISTPVLGRIYIIDGKKVMWR